MKKSIITIALLGLAGHAAADVTLYIRRNPQQHLY